MTKPLELEEAELLDALCQRWSCPPSVVLQQDVSALRGLAILALAHSDTHANSAGRGPAGSALADMMVSI